MPLRNTVRPSGRDGDEVSLTVRVVHDPLALGLVVTTVLLTALFAAGLVGVSTAVFIFWLVQPVLDVMLFVIARNIARSPALPGRMRRFWYALSFGGLSFAVGDAGQTVIALVNPGPQSAVPGVIQT